MIRALRLAHRRWFILLAVALPTLLFLALRGRSEAPTVDELPSSRAPIGSAAAEGTAQ